ncbi:hypothetical protein [Polaromonas sp. CG9_12]|nr:hypothetical protein [Polaromonas sp. CG9_12]
MSIPGVGLDWRCAGLMFSGVQAWSAFPAGEELLTLAVSVLWF